MSEFIIRPIALKQILTYFENPKNHSDDDKKHISKEEFKGAIGKISSEADGFLKEIVNSENGYTTLKAMQKEGNFNDHQVSMRDMYAANRGYGFNGEPVKLTYESLAMPVKINTAAESRVVVPQIGPMGMPLKGTEVTSVFIDGPLVGRAIVLDAGSWKATGTCYSNDKNIIKYEFWAEKNGDKIIQHWAGISMHGWDVKAEE